MPLQVGCGQTISASLYVAKVGIMTLPSHRMMCFSGKPSNFWFLFLRQTCRISYILILKKRTLTHEVWWPILRSWSSSIIRALDHHSPFCSFNTICPVVCCFSVPWLIWLTNPRPWMGDKNQKANYWEACIWSSLSPAKQMLIYWRRSVIKETRFHIWSYQRIIYNRRQYNCSLWGISDRSCRVYTQWKTVIKMSKNASNWFWRTGNMRRVRWHRRASRHHMCKGGSFRLEIGVHCGSSRVLFSEPLWGWRREHEVRAPPPGSPPASAALLWALRLGKQSLQRSWGL